MFSLKRFYRKYLRRHDSFEADLKRRRFWSTGLLGSLRRMSRKVASAFFIFHTPTWVDRLQNVVTPPDKKPTPIQLANPFYWIIWIWQFFLLWISTRSFSSIGPALPAVAVFGIMTVVAFQQQLHGSRWRKADYRSRFAKAMSTDDFDSANVILGAMIDMQPENLELRFDRGLLAEKNGNHEEAVGFMQRLVESKNYAPAALWLANIQYPLTNLANWTADDHRIFRTLVNLAMRDTKSAEFRESRVLMAKYLIQVGAQSDAILLLEQLIPPHNDLALSTAMLSMSLENVEAAKRYAQIAENYYQSILANQPGNFEARMSLVQALILNEREEAAIKILEDGDKVDDRPEIDIAWTQTKVAYARRLAKIDKDGSLLVQRLTLLIDALRVNGKDPECLSAIIQLAVECRNNNNQEVLRLRNAAINGLDPFALHFLQGTAALFDGKYEDAKMHLDLAYRQDQNLPGLLNNLAIALAAQGGESLSQSLELAELAVAQLPNNPYIRETRGQIYFKLKKYQEAIVDLEYALQVPEQRSDIYPSLAACYEALGQEEMAQDLRDAGELLKSKSTSKRNP